MRILVIEDDEDIAALLRQGLTQAGYQVTVALEGITGWRQAADTPFGLIVLDWMLPDTDGKTLCQRLRAQRITTPVLMLTARDALRDRVEGLDAGADDYLTKPFEFDELLARVRSLLRRQQIHKSRRIAIADLEIDTGLRRVARGGAEVRLTPREYALLESLATRQGQTLTREVIQELIWFDSNSLSNTVDVHVAALRRKIDAGHAVKLIETIPRVGYRLTAPEHAEPDLFPDPGAANP
ncbi:MAG: response regulator transcription factor [Cytophagales bacterium]|nr:response regulator transcription factor [Armatimonadota bacterium]